MSKPTKKISPVAMAFLFGIVFGVLLSMSINYPLDANEMDTAKQLCYSAGTVLLDVRVSISGNIKEVRCADRKTYYLK